MNPILIIGALGALAWALKASKPPEVANNTVDALIDPEEKMHPNAPNVRVAIAGAMQRNSLSLFESTAQTIEAARMPKTAANLRGWASMVKQGGNYVAGDEVGGVPRVRPRPVVKALRAGRHATLPDWLRAQATTAMLTGDPGLIEATAEVMGRLGYVEHKRIYLRDLAS